MCLHCLPPRMRYRGIRTLPQTRLLIRLRSWLAPNPHQSPHRRGRSSHRPTPCNPPPIAPPWWSFLPAPEPVAAPESVASVSLTDPASPVSFTAPSEVKPVGHWTSQLDGTVSENTAEVVVAPVSTTEAIPVEPIALTSVPTPTPTTANDLILPSMHDTGGVVRSAEGGMLLTDSISLPSSLGIMGAQPSQIDSPEVDRSLDRVEDIGTDFRPVT